MTIQLIRIRAPMRFNDALELQSVHGAELERCDEKIARLILLQHTPVFTLGRRTEKQHLLCSEHDLTARTGAEVLKADRGGSVTYHAPGQLTAYMLLNLRVWNLTIHQHLHLLEEAALKTLAHFGIQGHREQGMTGVWVSPSLEKGGQEGAAIGNHEIPSRITLQVGQVAPSAKICAIGISARRWVTYHGLSMNVDLELKPFNEIVPCGLAGKEVTSMVSVLQRNVNISEVENAMSAAFGEVYGATVEIGMV